MLLQRLKDTESWLAFLCNKYADEGRPHVVKLLRYASLERHSFGGENGKKVLVLWVRRREWSEVGPFSAFDLKQSIKAIATLHDAEYFRVSVYSPDEEPVRPIIRHEDLTTLGLNNCFFKTEATIEHNGLRFRSPAEIPVYEELKRRKLVFFPNAAAVFGEKALKKEPDFLICHKGKWGILEVMGKEHHNEKTAVQDHQRARLFKEHGIKCIEFFSGGRCLEEPCAVVEEFLNLLASY